MEERRLLKQTVIRDIQSLDKTRRKLDILYDGNQLSIRETEKLYGLLFISCLNVFESFVEDLFVRLLVGRVKPYAMIHPRAQFKSFRTTRKMIRGTNRYVSWLPYENTIKLAKVYFRDGNPFVAISANKEILQKMVWIRNSIAHKSSYATSKFQDKVIGSLSLTSRERNPGGFLRSAYRMSPRQTRIENYMMELILLTSMLLKC